MQIINGAAVVLRPTFLLAFLKKTDKSAPLDPHLDLVSRSLITPDRSDPTFLLAIPREGGEGGGLASYRTREIRARYETRQCGSPDSLLRRFT